MTNPKRIYLDNAATSWPKPDSVYDAVDRYQRQLGAPAGRSAYREAAEVERTVNDTRRRTANLIGSNEPARVIFTSNCTDSLNLALHGLLRPGDHVVTTVVEHNSVLRPLRFLEEQRGVTVTRVPCNALGVIDPDDVRAAIEPDTRLIAVIHASNVTGALQPVAEIGQIAREREIPMLVDAAQTIGHLRIDVRELGADLLAAAGHKGLLGPLGIGVLYIAPGLEQRLLPVRQGGTGTQSDDDHQPDSLPDRYESGNHNVPAIFGLGAGIEYLESRGIEEIAAHERQLVKRLLDGLTSITGVTVHSPGDPQRQLGVVSITVDGLEPQVFAMMLDAAQSIQVRAGIHCAPLMHRQLGTDTSGGTVRFSVGPFNTSEEIDITVAAVDELVSSQLG